MNKIALVTRFVPLISKVRQVVPITIQSQNISRWVAPTLRKLKRREDKLGGKKQNPRNTFLEWNLEAELYAFGKRLNEDFDSDLLLEAFTDRSYVIKEELKQKEMDIDIKVKDNRQLAEEGEKFIKEYIQLYLETALPKFPLEGVAGVRQHLTSESTLAHVSSHLGTKDMILAAEYPVDNLILANAFKAIVGALLQSSGEVSAAHFVRDFVITQLQGKDVNEYWSIEDPWGMLTSLLAKDNSTVEPRLIGETGKNTLLACFRVGLYVDKQMISSGFGETVATAKEMAAREALKKIFGTEDHMKPINFKLDGIPKRNAQMRSQISAS
ncbi:large ribosomal subunit protein mL44 [Ostrinia nubilalis]|uniref:large ribosomal subunit protein mL44 n=1 Tax=Ostrinia nubilalis TaxID=29057 RepID=UPI003082489F